MVKGLEHILTALNIKAAGRMIKKNGYGTLIYPDDKRYEEEWVNGTCIKTHLIE